MGRAKILSAGLAVLGTMSACAQGSSVSDPVPSPTEPSQASGPAEIPPASYSAKQYVDSKGCVFIRAGEGLRVIWVPRIARSREQLCGHEPSLTSEPSLGAEPNLSSEQSLDAEPNLSSEPSLGGGNT